MWCVTVCMASDVYFAWSRRGIGNWRFSSGTPERNDAFFREALNRYFMPSIEKYPELDYAGAATMPHAEPCAHHA